MTSNTRWMIRRDLDQVTDIERACFGDLAMSGDEIIKRLRHRNVIAHVWDTCWGNPASEIVGWVMYSLSRYHIEIERLAVHPLRQRDGCGSDLIWRMKKKTEIGDRDTLLTYVHESWLAGQLFLRKHGFLATKVIRDMYEFEWRRGTSSYQEEGTGGEGESWFVPTTFCGLRWKSDCPHVKHAWWGMAGQRWCPRCGMLVQKRAGVVRFRVEFDHSLVECCDGICWAINDDGSRVRMDPRTWDWAAEFEKAGDWIRIDEVRG